MASLYQPKVTRWVLDGKRVPPGTPGAVKQTTAGSKWYARGHPFPKPVPLSTDRAAAQVMLAELLRDHERGEVGLRDSVSRANAVPLEQHLADVGAERAGGVGQAAAALRPGTRPDACRSRAASEEERIRTMKRDWPSAEFWENAEKLSPAGAKVLADTMESYARQLLGVTDAPKHRSGDVVRLLSGGPRMTVEGVLMKHGALHLACAWYEDGEVKKHEVAERAVEKIEAVAASCPFSPGDVVRLKSGGPAMTVLGPAKNTEGQDKPDSVVCVWFDDKDLNRSHLFVRSELATLLITKIGVSPADARSVTFQ